MRPRSIRTLLLVTAVVGLAACGQTAADPEGDGTGSPSPDAVPSEFETSPEPTPTPTGEPEPEPTDPEPEPDPEPTTDGDDHQAHAGESVTLRDGDTVTIEELRITLLSATGPGEDCQDCPIQAEVEVTDGTDTERVSFSFSGNMAPGLAEEARTETVLGWTLRADRIVDGEMDLTATRA